MRKLFVHVAVVVLSAVAAFAESTEELDKRISAELRAKDPTSAQLWDKGNAARMSGKSAEAVAAYAMLLERVPQYDHALRRMAYEELELNNRTNALLHAREALALQRSPENLGALAQILVRVPIGVANEMEAMEARALVEEAVKLDPEEASSEMARAGVALQTEDLDTLRKAVVRLQTIAPSDAGTHVYAFYSAVNDHQYDAARASLDQAKALGLPQPSYEGMLEQLDGAVPFYIRWWKPVAITLAIWFGCFAALLVAGIVLSKIAVRAAHEAPADLSANATGLSSGVRKAYGTVLLLSSIFYYLSVPIVIGLVLLVGGGLVYGSFVIGHIPIKLVFLAIVLVGISIWSIVKSLFIRMSDDDPGMRLDLAKHPRLRGLLDEVAARIGTRAVDNVYMTPGTEMAVMERGKSKSKERCLILGVAGLDGLAVRPLKAVLGHEYGHFTNRDTSGGAFALKVRNSVSATAYALATGGAAAWYNPAWLFVNGFHRVFTRISEGASRLQEVLADRWAVFSYGADAFEAGLRHVVARGVRFDAHVGATLKEVVDGQLPLTNLYTYQPAQKSENIDEAIEEALQRQSSAYDSHPSPAERFALVRALPRHGDAPGDDDAMPAWSLFDDAAELQRLMTAQVRENVKANYGIDIAAGEAAPAV